MHCTYSINDVLRWIINTWFQTFFKQVTKNRFDGELGIMLLKFDRDTLSFIIKDTKDKTKREDADKSKHGQIESEQKNDAVQSWFGAILFLSVVVNSISRSDSHHSDIFNHKSPLPNVEKMMLVPTPSTCEPHIDVKNWVVSRVCRWIS